MSHRSWGLSIVAVLIMLVGMYAVPVVRSVGSGAQWTIMVYLDGDNNLDPDSVADIAEMETVGSTTNVNVIVLWDRYDQPAYLYKVVDGDVEQLSGMKVYGNDVNGVEVSMADWHVLEAFVDYCKDNYQAEHYALDLWDHGNAFGYTCWDDHAAPGWPSSARAISLAEVGMALDGFGTLDILTYDGCTIGMAEIAYELSLVPLEKVQIEYLVASEEYIPNSGYAYNKILEKMNDPASDMSAAGVATMLADLYAECYSPHGQAKGSSTVGLSVVDLSEFRPFASALDSLTSLLKTRLSEHRDYYHDLIAEARGEGNLGWSLFGWDDRIDMGAFLLTISTHAQDEEVAKLAGDALELLTSAVYVANTPALQSQSAFGLGVWFPSSYRSIGNANTGGFGVLVQYASAFHFAEDAGWLSFLYAYWGKIPKTK